MAWGKKKGGSNDDNGGKKEVSETCFCGVVVWAYPEDMETAMYVHQLKHVKPDKSE